MTKIWIGVCSGPIVREDSNFQAESSPSTHHSTLTCTRCSDVPSSYRIVLALNYGEGVIKLVLIYLLIAEMEKHGDFHCSNLRCRSSRQSGHVYLLCANHRVGRTLKQISRMFETCGLGYRSSNDEHTIVHSSSSILLAHTTRES